MATENGVDNEKVLYKYDENVLKARIPSNPVHPLILSRRSLRSMTGQPLSNDQLIVLFEAAHWAPSHFNGQLWRFVYAKRETEYWNAFFEALSEENQRWAGDASVLVVVISKSTMLNPHSNEEEFVKSHRFEAMVLEGSCRGLVLHAVNEFDVEKARDAIGLTGDSGSSQYTVEVMIAIGVPDLYNAEWEEITLRREIDHFISEGTFVEKYQPDEIDSTEKTVEENSHEEKAEIEDQQNDVPNSDGEKETKVEKETAEETIQTASFVDENSIEVANENAEVKENLASALSDVVEKEVNEELADKESENEPEKGDSATSPKTDPETDTPQ